MTNERIIELLAEREGWHKVNRVGAISGWDNYQWQFRNNLDTWAGSLPNYLHSLDAIQPILATLTDEEGEVFDEALATEFIAGPHIRSFTRYALTLKPDQLARYIVKAIADKGE